MRPPPGAPNYSFVGDRSHARRHQLLGLRAIRRQMQIGEQHLTAREFFALRGEWLLYLHDQFGAAKYGVAIRYDLSPSVLIISVYESCARPRLSLDYASRSALRPPISVLTQPGHAAFTAILSRSSAARIAVTAFSAAFEMR
jgi:hypothetical protein